MGNELIPASRTTSPLTLKLIYLFFNCILDMQFFAIFHSVNSPWIQVLKQHVAQYLILFQ